MYSMTKGTEINAEFSIFEPDERLLDFVRQRTSAAFKEQYPDPDAGYADRRTIDLATIEPLVARPDVIIRNAVNFGLLALECSGVSAAFEEAQIAEVSVEDWTVRNSSTGAVLNITPVPEALISLMQSGGIFPLLERE